MNQGPTEQVRTMARRRGLVRPRDLERVGLPTGDAFTEGVERHAGEGVEVSVYTPAKTIADLFKFRNKLGVDVSVEALRDAWARQLVTMEEILRFAKVCRMEKVMRP